MAKTRVAEMIIKADIKEEALNSREEALRENPFAGLFPSLKEAAAHKTLEKSLKRDMLKNSTMNQMLDEVVEKEQCEVPLIINEQDLVGVSLSKQGPEVSNMKVETVVAAEEIGKPDISFFYYSMMYFTTPQQDLLWVVWKATIFGHSLVLFY